MPATNRLFGERFIVILCIWTMILGLSCSIIDLRQNEIHIKDVNETDSANICPIEDSLFPEKFKQDWIADSLGEHYRQQYFGLFFFKRDTNFTIAMNQFIGVDSVCVIYFLGVFDMYYPDYYFDKPAIAYYMREDEVKRNSPYKTELYFLLREGKVSDWGYTIYK